jgi:hypothetical protein
MNGSGDRYIERALNQYHQVIIAPALRSPGCKRAVQHADADAIDQQVRRQVGDVIAAIMSYAIERLIVHLLRATSPQSIRLCLYVNRPWIIVADFV